MEELFSAPTLLPQLQFFVSWFLLVLFKSVRVLLNLTVISDKAAICFGIGGAVTQTETNFFKTKVELDREVLKFLYFTRASQ